ncbi:MAG: alpha/beta fold hydrolase [Actinobacteria bacterium]|nr:alpha/beta fold hydrolase [Actinomycetota bacterium]
MTAPIMAGAQAWSFSGGSAAVLVLHGFTGTPQSMRPLAQAYAGAGFTVELPLLPGHGSALEDMLPTRFDDWAGAAEFAYMELASRCSPVLVSGLSMGGTLACKLVVDHPEIAAAIVINPLLDPPEQALVDLLAGLLESGEQVAPGVGSDISRPGVQELAYDGTPIAAALSLFEGVGELATQLSRICCPVLLFSSRQDHVVPPSSGDLLERAARGPLQRVWLERSFHVATLDLDRETVEKTSVRFALEVTGGLSSLQTLETGRRGGQCPQSGRETQPER